MDKLRKRFLRDAWDRYKTFLLKCRQHDRNVISGDKLKQTWDRRKLRRCFDAYCAFTQYHKKAKGRCGRMLQHMELWMKKKAITTWLENGHMKRMYEINLGQHTCVGQIEGMGRSLNSMDSTLDVQLK